MANGPLTDEEIDKRAPTPTLSDSFASTQADIPAVIPKAVKPIQTVQERPFQTTEQEFGVVQPIGAETPEIAPEGAFAQPGIAPTGVVEPISLEAPEVAPAEAFIPEVALAPPTDVTKEIAVEPIQEVAVRPREEITKEEFFGVDPNTGEPKNFNTLEKANASKVKLAENKAKKEEQDKQDGKFATIFDSALDIAADVLDLDTPDPIKEAQFNHLISTIGSTNQAQTDQLILQLKQQGIFGEGAGNAWMLSLARSQGKNFSDIVMKLNVDSAKRILEWTEFGPELAQKIRRSNLQYKVNSYDFGRQQINDQISAGETDPNIIIGIANQAGINMSPEVASNLIKLGEAQTEATLLAVNREVTAPYNEITKTYRDLIPGLEVNGSLLLGRSPSEQTDFRIRVDAIAKELLAGNLENAQEMMKQLKSDYPNVVIGNYDEWNPDDFTTLEDSRKMIEWIDQAEAFLGAGDPLKAADIIRDNVIDKDNIPEDFKTVWDSMSPDRKVRVLEQAGLTEEPVTEEEMLEFLTQDYLNGLNPGSTDSIIDSYYKNAGPEFRAWLMTPGNENVAREWIFALKTLGTVTLNDDGTIVPSAGDELPPWNPNSNRSHYYKDWGMGSELDENGNVVLDYPGGNVIDNTNTMMKDANYLNYVGQVNKNWESYIEGGGTETRQEWFDRVNPTWDGENLKFNEKSKEPLLTPGELIAQIATLTDTQFSNALGNDEFIKSAVDNGLFIELDSTAEIAGLTTAELDDTFTSKTSRGVIVVKGVPFFVSGSGTTNQANVQTKSDGFQTSNEGIVAKGSKVVMLGSDKGEPDSSTSGTQIWLILDGKDAGKVVIWTPGLTKFGELKSIDELGNLQIDIDKQQKLKDEGNFALVP